MIDETARFVGNLARRVDALALDLARDGGALVRDARALYDATEDRAVMIGRATPRLAKLAQIAAQLAARAKWLRLAQAARTGDAVLRPEDHRELARRAAAAAAELRGGIAKLGQLASCRPDLIGAVWAGELAMLRDEVPPIDAASIRHRIESELGKPIDEVFAAFDDAPLAAASLAQVHAAELADGTRVVVKVQVPGIEHVIAADIAALRALAGALADVELPGVDLATLAAELVRALERELDYVAEAEMLEAFAGDAPGVIVPRPIRAASAARVLTMTRIDGERLADWLAVAAPADRDRVLGELVGEVAAQVLARGRVHADPHPGNFLVERGQLALLDFGCVLELSAAERGAYARLVLAIFGGDRASTARELAQLGFSAADPAQLTELAESFVGALRPGADAAQLDWTAAFADQLARARAVGGIAVPRSFVLLGRVLAAVGGLLATYRPRLELHAVIARHLAVATMATG